MAMRIPWTRRRCGGAFAAAPASLLRCGMRAAFAAAEPLSLRSRRVALWLVLATLGCAAAGQAQFAAAHAALAGSYDEVVRHRNAALLCYALLVVPTTALCRWTRGWSLPTWSCRSGWRIAMIVLVLAAGWLRFHRLEELPPGLWVDEALNGVQARQIAADGRLLVALPEEDVRTGLGAGFVDVAGLAFALVDPNDGPYALRAVAAVIGTVGVAAAGALAWTLIGVRGALVATAWLAVSQYHLNYSRWGEMPIMSSVVETLAALALVVGLRARGARAWVACLAAGVLAGAGLYTYQTFRLFVVLAGLAAAVLAWRHRRALMELRAPLAAAALVGILVAAPMLRYAVLETREFGERAQDTLIPLRPDWRPQLAEAVTRSLLAFQFVGDDNPRHNLPFAPLLTFVPALLAPIGLIVCIADRRRPADAIVPLWFAIALVPGMITLEAPHASRLLDAIVPLALMIGIAADRLLGVLQAALPGRRLGLVAGAIVAAAAGTVTAVAELEAYFVARERLPSFVDAFFPSESEPGRYLAAHLPTETVYLDPDTFWAPATRFVAWHYLNDLPVDVRMLRLLHDFPPAHGERGALVLLPPPYLSLVEPLRAAVPGTVCDETRDAFGRVDLAACRIPPTATDAPRWRYGLRGRFYRNREGGAPHVQAMLPFGYLPYTIEEPPLGRFGLAVWDGFIDLPAAGEYLFRLHPDATSLTIDGREIIASAGAAARGGASEGRATLPAGRLPIRITLQPGPQAGYFLWFYWQPPGAEIELVPATALRPPADMAEPP